jgi:hypothetical protein
MARATAPERNVVQHLTELIKRDLDAMEAYEAAISRLPDPADKAQLARFMGDHERHVVDLSLLVQQAGGVAPTRGRFKRILTTARVVLLGVAGNAGVLEAMKSNEDATIRIYDRAKNDPDLSVRARSIVAGNFADEQRHVAWIEQRLRAVREELSEGSPPRVS